MSYSFTDGSSMSEQLEKRIRKVHEIVGNANTTGRFIVFGSGSTPLLNAAVYALSLDNSSFPAGVVASIPYYPAYKEQTNFFRSLDYRFIGDTSMWENTSYVKTNVIEFVTSPNNPDAQLKKAVLQGPFVKTIYDHAYYWPHFTAIPAPADEDLMIFTLSKLTGHAGSRFGWALIKNETVYQRMVQYTEENSFGVSRDTQLRAMKLLKVVLEGEGKEIFDFGYKTMKVRWEKLSKILSVSKRFSIQQIAPRYCTYFQQVRGPSPVLNVAGIIGCDGNLFGAGSGYVRLSLIRTRDDFDLMLQKMKTLVSEEDGIETLRRRQSTFR